MRWTLTRYRAPYLDGYRVAHRFAFNIGPRGNLYALFKMYKVAGEGYPSEPDQYVILKYGDSGHVDYQVFLSGLPMDLRVPFVLQVFGNGDFLVAGRYDTDSRSEDESQPGFGAPRALPSGAAGQQPTPGHQFIGIFDNAGHFMQQLKLGVARTPESDATPDAIPGEAMTAAPATTASSEQVLPNPSQKTPSKDSTSEAPQVVMTAAPDGDVYLLLPSNPAALYEITANGQILHEVPIKWPAVGFGPSQMSTAGSARLYVTFAGETVDQAGQRLPTTMIALVDALNGEIIAASRLPRSIGALPSACAVDKSDLLVLGLSPDRGLQVFRYQTN